MAHEREPASAGRGRARSSPTATSTSATTRGSSGATARSSGPARLVGLLLGLVVALVQTPEYRAGVLLQIEPPTPTVHDRDRRARGRRGTTGRTPTSTTPSSRCCARRASARRWSSGSSSPTASRSSRSSDPASLFMSHVGVEPVPESRLVMRHGDPPRPARGGAVGEHARRRLHRPDARGRGSSRRARPTSGCRSGSPRPRRACARRRTSSSRATSSQDLFVPEGSVSAVSTSIAQAQRGLRAGAGAADRDRGRAQAGARDAAAGARSSTRCRRSPPTRP